MPLLHSKQQTRIWSRISSCKFQSSSIVQLLDRLFNWLLFHLIIILTHSVCTNFIRAYNTYAIPEHTVLYIVFVLVENYRMSNAQKSLSSGSINVVLFIIYLFIVSDRNYNELQILFTHFLEAHSLWASSLFKRESQTLIWKTDKWQVSEVADVINFITSKLIKTTAKNLTMHTG